MTITPERLAAFADGELPEGEMREIEALVAADPDLARQVAAHRALRQRLSAHFEPILKAPLPEHLVARLTPPGPQVINLAKARQQRDSRRSIPRWTWLVVPALAASLVLFVMVPLRDKNEAALIEGRIDAGAWVSRLRRAEGSRRAA